MGAPMEMQLPPWEIALPLVNQIVRISLQGFRMVESGEACLGTRRVQVFVNV